MGASKKVVSSAMRRPLKSLGRAVARKDSSLSRSRQEDEDALIVSRHIDPVVMNLDSVNGYGAVSEPHHDPDNGMALSSSHRSMVGSESRAIDWPVHSMEQFTRLLLLLCAAYTVGAKHPQWTEEVARIAEYVLTAWITCGLILMLGFFQRNCPQWVPGFRGGAVLQQQQSMLQPIAREAVVSARPLPLATAKKVSPIPPSTSPLRDISEPIDIIEFASLAPVGPAPPETPLSHPALARLYVVDTATNERIYCNTEQPTHVSTEWFEMDTMILIRTPDVDDPKAEKGSPGNAKWSDYMRGKQRRFEFQYQIKLKKVPVGKDVYFSCEVEEPIKMGIIQRAFVGAAMAFMKSTNPTFHYSITGSKERTTDGKYERPHMSFTVEGSLDRLVISKPGEKVPQLGTVIHEDPESIKRRKKGGLVDWNLQDTYTMALWSSYVDFLDWRVINLPGIRPFGLSSVLGSQAFYLTMYMIDKDRNSDKHFQKDIDYVVNWELGNDKEAEKGPHASEWAKANQRTRLKPRRLDSGDGTLSLDVEGEMASRSADEFHAEEIEDDDDAETAAELGEGIYMRSGDRVCLREFLRGADDEGKGAFVANGGGFAIFQEQDVEVIIEKTRRSMKNRLIKSGDTVMFKMVPRNKEHGTRYLTIHRGWWLKWVSSVPSKNGFFTISTHDGSMETPDICGQTADSQAVYLTMGGPFTLRHKRWSSYFVGVAGEPSPTYGGRMLGLYNPTTTQQIDEQYQSDEGEYEDGEPDLKATKPTWMRPLVLSAIEAQFSPLAPTSPRKLPELAYPEFDAIADASKIHNARRMTFCHEQAHADVPAWIEMMNRRDRVRQLAYVVRVGIRPKDDQRSDDSGPEELDVCEKDTESFFRLRTGRELAQIMSVGQRVTDFVNPDDSPRHRARVGGVDTGFPLSPKTTPPRNQLLDAGSAVAAKKEVGTGDDKNYESVDADLDAEASEDDESVEYPTEVENVDSGDCAIQGDEIDEEGEEIGLETDTDESEGEGNVATDAVKQKRRGMMDKSKALLGKSVKATVGAAKLGVKTTKLTGKVSCHTTKNRCLRTRTTNRCLLRRPLSELLSFPRKLSKERESSQEKQRLVLRRSHSVVGKKL